MQVVSDILESLTKLESSDFSFETLGKIGALALFRTALAYALGYEVKELQKEILEREDGKKLILKKKKIVQVGTESSYTHTYI